MAIKKCTELENKIKIACSIAVKETAKQAQEVLHQYILEQYYQDPGFYPSTYNRTETFLNSALSKMISNTSAEIYIDIEGMHYKNGFSPTKVVEWAANSQHGADYYQTDMEPFWTKFIQWCDINLFLILKQNLKRQNVSIK